MEGALAARFKGSLFFNPSSGSGVTDDDREELKALTQDAGLRFIPVTPEISIPNLIREGLSRGERLFIAAGGDGTANHVVQALVQSEGVFAIIPVGTYNHFARDLGIPLKWKEAFVVALGETTTQVDVGKVNERYFLNNISLGLYPDAVRRREEKGRDYPKWKAIPYAAFMALKKFQSLSITIETSDEFEATQTQLFMVSNNAYDISRIGLEAHRPTLQGGKLSVHWLPRMPRLRFILLIARYIGGKVDDFPGFRSIQTGKLKVRPAHSRVRVGLDGEVVSMNSPLVLTAVPLSLRVRIPAPSGEASPEGKK